MLNNEGIASIAIKSNETVIIISKVAKINLTLAEPKLHLWETLFL